MSRFSARPAEAAASPAAAVSVRGAIDALVQSSLVDLFAAYQVAVAPLPRHSAGRLPPVPEVTAAIAFVRKEAQVFSGRMTLSLPSAVLELTKHGSGRDVRGDWARELANQLIGRIKNRLLQFSVRLETGATATLDSGQLSQHLALSASSVRVYSGRTLRGEALVTLEGMPDDSQLVYLGPVNVASEGDVILF